MQRILGSLVVLIGLSAGGQGAETEADLKPIIDLYKSGKLFEKSAYKEVRGAASAVFEAQNAPLFKQAWGDDLEAINKWFEKQKELKEEFYTAINEKKDKIELVLKIFRDLWKADADAVARYPNLAIAISVVWDVTSAREPNIYDYRGHQIRTKSRLPEDYLKHGAVDEFKYFVSREKTLQGKESVNRLKSLPWEFLVYCVDHRTPVVERDWAVKNYLAKRKMIGGIYTSDVEYDVEMLRTKSQVCRLNDKDYTLPDIKKYGGVCAMQADFAARVGKSLVVPAAYVRGEGKDLGLHAWVMWVEVQSAGATQVRFTLESHGRYQGDNYYTGEVHDPQTGDEILDRDMERRLAAAATDRNGKRSAELAMEYYDALRSLQELDAKKRIRFLDGVLKLSSVNEEAWNELAKMVRDGEVPADMKQTVLEHMEKLIFVFNKYPDFSWKIANDLIVMQNAKQSRNYFFERLAKMYETASRPDLTCEARLKWADYLAEDEKWELIAKGLNPTLIKFADEGRYVPKMLAKMKEACGNYKAGGEYLAKTYVDLMKKIPPRRGDEVTKYYVQMAKEAREYLKSDKKYDKMAKDVEASIRAANVSIP